MKRFTKNLEEKQNEALVEALFNYITNETELNQADYIQLLEKTKKLDSQEKESVKACLEKRLAENKQLHENEDSMALISQITVVLTPVVTSVIVKTSPWFGLGVAALGLFGKKLYQDYQSSCEKQREDDVTTALDFNHITTP